MRCRFSRQKPARVPNFVGYTSIRIAESVEGDIELVLDSASASCLAAAPSEAR